MVPILWRASVPLTADCHINADDLFFLGARLVCELKRILERYMFLQKLFSGKLVPYLHFGSSRRLSEP